MALGTVLTWGLTGPMFHYSETWQLVINTGTTITSVTFLLAFLIRRAHNKDSLVLHLKLNELLAAHKGASNCLVNAQDFSENEIHLLHRYFDVLAEMARKERPRPHAQRGGSRGQPRCEEATSSQATLGIQKSGNEKTA